MSAQFCIDAGNTRIKWALIDAGANVVDAGAISTQAFLAGLDTLPEITAPHAVVACNVASSEVVSRIEALYKKIYWLQSQAECAGVRNHYKIPAQLGVDRFAALVAAHAAPCDQLVVMCGTALTVDALSSRGDFLGGVIAPGLTLMRQSLARGTAQLPFAVEAVGDLPRSTQQAIGTGTLLATLGVIEGVRNRMQAAEATPLRLVLSGGWAEALSPHLPSDLEVMHRPHLVLQGLARSLAKSPP